MLASATIPAMSPVGIEGTHTYAYDALGRRVAKTVDDGMSGLTTVSVRNGERILAEYPSGTSATTPDKEYVYGTYVDELIALIDRTALGATAAGSDETLYAHHSHQYHVIALSDTSGTIFERYAFAPYGELTILNPAATSTRTASDIANPVTYTGRWHDPETTLYHFRARMLHPRLGRFIGRDALAYVDGTNLYRTYFVASHIDPSGTYYCKPKATCPPDQDTEHPPASGCVYRDQDSLGVDENPTWTLTSVYGFVNVAIFVADGGVRVYATGSATWSTLFWGGEQSVISMAECTVSCVRVGDACEARVSCTSDGTDTKDYVWANAEASGEANGACAQITAKGRAEISHGGFNVTEIDPGIVKIEPKGDVTRDAEKSVSFPICCECAGE